MQRGETFSRTSAIKPAMLPRYMQHRNLWEVSRPENRLWRCSGFRSELETFRKMGAIKPELVLRYMQQYRIMTISLSDTDTVWLRDPKGGSHSRCHSA